MELPKSLCSPNVNVNLIQAALTAGMFPKIISIDPPSGQMQTINNNRPVAFHPSSVNFRRPAREFNLLHGPITHQLGRQSKKLYTSETGPANDFALILLCGDCEFKVASELVIVDRKLKYQVPGKTILALKALRSRLASNMAFRLRSRPPDSKSEDDIWAALALQLFTGPTAS
ncbi:ATP-dependent DEAH-box RNA helicase [Ceratobasidium theobromae]|uniref:ATP-dependent DEAH-box RNA helicase n=1 Tax=Ceratobasidium theobromae TaxID=1582974 RepID=A0A5N5QKN2_9AGAM|nr:ATP-dependent DEAH-box RNA helicase [Ceratobasidium theobromae]